MIAAILIAGTLALATLALHAATCGWMISKRHGGGTVGLFGTCCLLVALHLFEVALFAGGYQLGEALGIGYFEEPAGKGFMDVYYFSLATFATLGLGKLMPTGHVAFIAGVEGIVGFLCVTLSASTLFQTVQRRIAD